LLAGVGGEQVGGELGFGGVRAFDGDGSVMFGTSCQAAGEALGEDAVDGAAGSEADGIDMWADGELETVSAGADGGRDGDDSTESHSSLAAEEAPVEGTVGTAGSSAVGSTAISAPVCDAASFGEGRDGGAAEQIGGESPQGGDSSGGGGGAGFTEQARAILSGLDVETLRRDARREGVEHQVMARIEALQRLLSDEQ